MKIMDRQTLINYLRENPHSVLFPLLAEEFLLSEEYSKGHEVCSQGLTYHPDSTPGLFIDARIFLAEGKLKKTEQRLKEVIALDPEYYQAYVLLAEVQTHLKRATTTLEKLFIRILELDEHNKQASEWLSSFNKKKSNKKGRRKSGPKISGKKTKSQNTPKKVKTKPTVTKATERGQKRVKKSPPSETNPKVRKKSPFKQRSSTKPKPVKTPRGVTELKISPEIATFTLVSVLKNQHLYTDALDVLTVMLKKKGANKGRIEEERKRLTALLKNEGEKI